MGELAGPNPFIPGIKSNNPAPVLRQSLVATTVSTGVVHTRSPLHLSFAAQ
jgi:hypothetical protein